MSLLDNLLSILYVFLMIHRYAVPACTDILKGTVCGVLCLLGLDGIIRQAIYQLKYKNLRALAITLAGLLWDYFITNPVPGEILVPVPLH